MQCFSMSKKYRWIFNTASVFSLLLFMFWSSLFSIYKEILHPLHIHYYTNTSKGNVLNRPNVKDLSVSRKDT